MKKSNSITFKACKLQYTWSSNTRSMSCIKTNKNITGIIFLLHSQFVYLNLTVKSAVVIMWTIHLLFFFLDFSLSLLQTFSSILFHFLDRLQMAAPTFHRSNSFTNASLQSFLINRHDIGF